MRNVFYAINLSIDGCCDHTKFGGSEEMLEYYTNLIGEAGLIIYGRKTYELMVPYWPDIAKSQSETRAENDYARIFTVIDKIVVSRTLNNAEGNTRIIRDNLRDEILKLKQEPGKKISIGGVDLPGQLIALDLVDEFYFVVHPVIVGEGRRLFEYTTLRDKLNLKLVASKVFKSGSVALHYLKR